VGLGALKIIKIRSLTPPIACESERGPAPNQEQVFKSIEVRVSLLVDVNDQEFELDEVGISLLVDDELYSARAREIIPQTRGVLDLPACYNESTAVRAREAINLTFVDEDLAPRAIPERIYARKPCARAYEYAPASSSTFGKLFPAAAVASKSRRLNSRGRPQSRGNRRFREPFRPKPVVAKGQGRVDCRGRVPREHSASPRSHSQGREDRGEVCPLLRCTPSRRVLRFPCICPIATRGNEEGSGALQQPPPEQEDKKSSPFLSMELKFKLDTRLTVSCACVVAVASAYGLLSVSIALDSILLAFGNAVILLLILFVLFGWQEFLGEFKKRTSMAN
jgi:hypothetical protein